MEPITEAPQETEAVPEPDETRARRNPTNVALVATIIVGLVASVVFVVLAIGARSDADDARSRTHSLRARLLVLQEQASAAARRRDHVRELARATQSGIQTLGTALDDSGSAQNAYADATNRAADLYNSGDPDGAAATFRAEGQAAFDAMAARVAAADQALTAARAAVQDLEEELR